MDDPVFDQHVTGNGASAAFPAGMPVVVTGGQYRGGPGASGEPAA